MKFTLSATVLGLSGTFAVIYFGLSVGRSYAAEPGSSPIVTAAQSHGGRLADDTLEWTRKYAGINLEDPATYRFQELSGSTSINLKIQKVDPSDITGHKSRGSFVARNSAANPDIEAAAFNLGVLLGFDRIYRPAVKYKLGPVAKAAFKRLLLKKEFSSPSRRENKRRILLAIAKPSPLPGVLKAKKDDSTASLDAITDPRAGSNGGPRGSHPIIRLLQASNPQPVAGRSITLKNGYAGNELELAREYSIIMLIDAVTQQWDRYSGGNVTIRKDKAGKAHFYATDNGGADFSRTWSNRNIDWFSRYDRTAVAKLIELLRFLDHPQTGLLGYTNAESFIIDLGLDSELKPADYAALLRHNIAAVLDRVNQNKSRFGESTFLPEP